MEASNYEAILRVAPDRQPGCFVEDLSQEELLPVEELLDCGAKLTNGFIECNPVNKRLLDKPLPGGSLEEDAAFFGRGSHSLDG